MNCNYSCNIMFGIGIESEVRERFEVSLKYKRSWNAQIEASHMGFRELRLCCFQFGGFASSSKSKLNFTDKMLKLGTSINDHCLLL